MVVDWSDKLVVVSDSGRECEGLLKSTSIKGERKVFWETTTSAYAHAFYDDGAPHPGLSCWEVRNAAPQAEETPPIPAPIAERMRGLIERMAGVMLGEWTDEARSIMAELVPVSQDDVEGRRLAYEMIWSLDNDTSIDRVNELAAACVARGRELERDGRK